VTQGLNAQLGLRPEVMLEGAERNSGPVGGKPGRCAGVTALRQKLNRRFEYSVLRRGGPVNLLLFAFDDASQYTVYQSFDW